MILEQQHLTEILTESGSYDYSLIKQLFSYKLLQEKVSPLGNIFCFEAPTSLGPLYLESALIVAAELPKTDTFGAACFQRLLATQIGTFVSMQIKKDCWLDQNCLFVEDKQLSITVLNQIKNSVVFNIIIPIKHSIEAVNFFQLDLPAEELTQLKQNIIGSFHFLTENLFIETCRDNF
jgi:hypothetical protein